MPNPLTCAILLTATPANQISVTIGMPILHHPHVYPMLLPTVRRGQETHRDT